MLLLDTRCPPTYLVWREWSNEAILCRVSTRMELVTFVITVPRVALSLVSRCVFGVNQAGSACRSDKCTLTW